MSYFSIQSTPFSELLAHDNNPVVLIAEPEEYRYGIYARHLRSQGMAVHGTGELGQVNELARAHRPDLLLCSVEFLVGVEAVVKELGRIRRGYPALPVVSVGYQLHHNHIRELSRLGVSGHIDRHTTRPHDVLSVIYAILSS